MDRCDLLYYRLMRALQRHDKFRRAAIAIRWAVWASGRD
jgi:hypothetical protein